MHWIKFINPIKISYCNSELSLKVFIIEQQQEVSSLPSYITLLLYSLTAPFTGRPRNLQSDG